MNYEKKDEVLSRFNPTFLHAYKDAPIVQNILERLIKGEDIYSVMEYLCEQHVRDTEILKEYYHPNNVQD